MNKAETGEVLQTCHCSSPGPAPRLALALTLGMVGGGGHYSRPSALPHTYMCPCLLPLQGCHSCLQVGGMRGASPMGGVGRGGEGKEGVGMGRGHEPVATPCLPPASTSDAVFLHVSLLATGQGSGVKPDMGLKWGKSHPRHCQRELFGVWHCQTAWKRAIFCRSTAP